MSLETYKKKRDFKETPEPQAVKAATGAAFTFVVQKHFARRLHYDLRLEMEGVFKSWAVPKGPSMVAGDKRLAVMVEDHPLDYGDFYGEIPQGNYGAGRVEIWDRGKYASALVNEGTEQHLLKRLADGNLKFLMWGTHLKGEFALVRLNTDKNEWLLIKKKDEYAQDEFDVEEIKSIQIPPSDKVKEKKKSSTGNKTTPATQFPAQLPQPMLAKLSEKVVDREKWIYEIKYDGYRLLSTISNGKTELISRNGNLFTAKFESIAAELKGVKDQVILDGELVIEKENGLNDFQQLQNYSRHPVGELKYYVFDMLYLNGHSIEEFPLEKRKELLESFFNKYKFKNIYHAPFQRGGGKELFEELSAKGFEGVIAKDPNGSYQQGKRTGLWLKIKAIREQEAIICGYTAPQKGRKYFGSILLGLFEHGKLKFVGNCGTGFSDTSLKELHARFEKLRTDVSPFDPPPVMSYTKGKPVWIKPQIVCNIKFTEFTDKDHFRHPVFLGVREDKNVEEITKVDMEQVLEKKPENKVFTFNGKKVKSTNLNKVYWPEEGYTKGDLIKYYQGISKYILPHLKDRPQSLNRYPNGINAPSFYHKNMEVKHLPEWVQTHKVKSDSKEIDYLICNDVATLIYMANLGCIEIHPWHSTRQRPSCPTYMMIDLDPGDIDFKEVVNVALVVKEVCDELGIPSYCKTSGSRGLHIYIPLGGAYSYGQIKLFAELLAGITHSRIPSVTSLERSKSKRKNKIYIDFLQNRKGQTIAAPYSVRPRPMATVSAPLKWSEVNHRLSPQMFTIKNMLTRVEKIGDIWLPVLNQTIDLLQVLDKVENLD